MSASPLVSLSDPSSASLAAPSSSTLTSYIPSSSSQYGYASTSASQLGRSNSPSRAANGISDNHSRSASLPLSTSPYPSSPSVSSRQLPPGASYAPENPYQRQAPSLPSSLNLEYAARGVQGGSGTGEDVFRQQGRGLLGSGIRPAKGLLGTVTERGLSSAGGAGSASLDRQAGESVDVSYEQGRKPTLLPELPRQPGLYGAASSRSSPAHEPRPALPTHDSSPSALPAQHPPQAYYSPAASAPLATASSSPSPAPPPLQQRSSFTGIPGGRLPHSTSTRDAVSAAERASNIPSFVPAPAFSSADRGPYPPHVSPIRSRREENASISSFAAPAGLVPPAPGTGGASGEEAELLVTPTDHQANAPSPSSAISPSASFSPSGAAFSVNIADGRPGSLAFTDLPDDMAGIGRNSVIRAATSASAPSAAVSPVKQQQQVQLASPTRPGSGPKSPQLVGPSPQALQSAQQAQPGVGGVEYTSSSAMAQGTPTTFALHPPPQPVALSPPPPPVQLPAQSPLPPHLTPQPEICVECMMRDRDMVDVDVTGEGVWERESDKEWEEQLRWEGENPLLPPSGESSGEHVGGSQESGPVGVNGLRARRVSGAASFSRESVGGRSSTNHAVGVNGVTRRRLGRGQALTTGNLKVLTSMNPPAAAHRWRTLQTYLATQIHLIELERQAREAAAAAAQREDAARAAETRPRSYTSTNASIRNRSSSLLSPAALAAEKYAIEQEERQARLALKAVKTRSRATLADETNRYSSASLLPPATSTSPIPMQMGSPQAPFASSSAASIRSYSAGDQPWLGNQLRRFSSPNQKDNSPPKSPAPSTSSATRGGGYGFGFGKFARSTTDLRSSGGAFATASPRSVSPARTSVGLDDGRRTSMWSRFRQSASASVLSFAPSGSMMDMHLGLSQDKHMPYAHHPGQHHYPAYDTYPSMSDPAVARHAEQLERERVLAASSGSGGVQEGGASGKKKKKGIKGFFNKLVGGGGKKGQVSSASAPATPGADLAYGTGAGGPYGGDDDELAPPPPLSALVNEPRYHQRSASNSSVDSFGPYTPPLHPANFRASTYTAQMSVPEAGGPYRSAPADRQSILTMGSYTSRRSQPSVANGQATMVSRNSFGRPSMDSLREPTAASLPRLGSPGPVVVDNQGEPEVLVDEGTGGPSPFSPDSPLACPQPRLQKSLPSLPSEAMYYPARQPSYDQEGFSAMLPPPNLPYAHYNASRSAHSLTEIPSRTGGDDLGGYDDRQSATVGRKSRSRSKVFSMNFGGFGKKSKQNLRAGAGGDEVPPIPSTPVQFLSNSGRGNSLDSAVELGYAGGRGDFEYDGRDGASSFRYVR
ncbi:hypothetical protein JCM11251_001042 [Rhodosporidiobolus azoricus]